MIYKTSFTIDRDLINKAIEDLPNIEIDSKFSLNQPIGNFFYDPWVIKPQFEKTVWNDLLKTLPSNIGEARLIKLDPGKCYVSHSDIDDRYHLNLKGNKCYLIDLDKKEMFPLETESLWYSMDASPRHTAANFGNILRVQLVVRKLLKHNNIQKPINIKILSNILDLEDRRFAFDDFISTWLNRANKRGIIDNFSYNVEFVSFDIESENIKELSDYLPREFFLEVS